jgi:hypothetical protein
MKFIATISNATQKYDVYLEVGDDDAVERACAALDARNEQLGLTGGSPSDATARGAKS